ncbi:MAG: PDGLE domain-containing protein [Methanobacteriaceae archaeon]
MESNNKKLIIIGIAIAIIIGVAAPFIASSNPDGLESAAEKIMYPHVSDEAVFESPFPDYSIPELGEGGISGVIPILVGIIAVFAIAYGLGIVLKKKSE